MKYYLNWKSYWDNKSECGPLISTGRSGSSISDLHLYLSNTISSLGGVNKKDTILDAGAGAGYISMMLSPRVKKIYLCDYSKKMIKKAKQAAEEVKCKPKIMMVTILTALNDADLKDTGNNNTVAVQVKKLAQLAKEMNVGVVCSGLEAKAVRKIIGPNLLIFTPGIRMENNNKDDQQRICTPAESIKNGSDKIIMGRSLIAGDIEENLNRVTTSIKI